MDSPNPTSSNRVAFGKKIRTLAIGVVAAGALAIPAMTSLSMAGHDAARVPVRQPVRISPDSHRLALSLHTNSVRLT